MRTPSGPSLGAVATSDAQIYARTPSRSTTAEGAAGSLRKRSPESLPPGASPLGESAVGALERLGPKQSGSFAVDCAR
eukprot:3517294-Pyramimonas_sp.AAC.1